MLWRILIVDRNPISCATLGRLLMCDEYRIMFAHNLADAGDLYMLAGPHVTLVNVEVDDLSRFQSFIGNLHYTRVVALASSRRHVVPEGDDEKKSSGRIFKNHPVIYRPYRPVDIVNAVAAEISVLKERKEEQDGEDDDS